MMRLIETPSLPAAGDPNVRHMTRWEAARSRLYYWCARNISRRLPRLIWIGQEVDVIVTFTTDKLDATTADEGLRQLFSGAIADIERSLSYAGIDFDRGIGFAGRDWEWDWSLKGPISVRFRGQCHTSERRRERPRPRLVAAQDTPHD